MFTKEIRLENFSDIKKMFDEVKSQSVEKSSHVQKDLLLIGKDVINKFEEVYKVTFPDHAWVFADERYTNLKIKGSAKLVYVGRITLVADNRGIDDRMTEGYICAQHIEMTIEYKGYLLWSGCRSGAGEKTYRLYFYNDAQDVRRVKTEYPQKFGTLTDKKADVWLDCLLDEKKRAIENDNANIAKVKQFKNMLADLLHLPLSEFEDDFNTFDLGMFSISYKCDVKTGYTSSKIDFDICAKKEDGKTYLTTFDRIKILADAGLLK